MKHLHISYLLLLGNLSFSQNAHIGEITAKLHPVPIRFDAIIEENTNRVALSIINSTDTIVLTGQKIIKNEYLFEFPVFNTYIRLKKENKHWTGHWTDKDKKESYTLTLRPKSKNQIRYPLPDSRQQQARYLIYFNRGTNNERPAILEFFPHSSGQVKGSVLTTAGDYRFLQGSANGDSVILSTFDGKFAYVFAAQLMGDSLYGIQYSPGGPPREFSGMRDDNAQLPDPESLTKIAKEETTVRFTLPDTDGRNVEFIGDRQQHKLTLITIGGSWCPNCMDEARFLNQIYNEYRSRGLHVIGVYFEYTDQMNIAIPLLRRMKEQLKLDFPILYGGSVRRQAAAKVFPQIEKILAYPTLIAIDSKGQIIKTYTGFYGPGTSLFKEYEAAMKNWLDNLLSD